MLMKSPVPGVLKSRMDFHLFETRFEMDDLPGTFLNFRSKIEKCIHSGKKQAAVLKFPLPDALTTAQPQLRFFFHSKSADISQ